MSGEIKILKQPSSRKDISSVTPLEWFKCNFDGNPGIAMIIAGPERLVRTHSVLFVNKDGGLRHLTVDSLCAYSGEFLGYLTTEERVTICGSLDPNWGEPEPEVRLAAPYDPPIDPFQISDVHINVPFIFYWDFTGSKHIGIRLPLIKDPNRWCCPRVELSDPRDGGWFDDGYDVGGRRFISYLDYIPKRLTDLVFNSIPDGYDTTGISQWPAP